MESMNPFELLGAKCRIWLCGVLMTVQAFAQIAGPQSGVPGYEYKLWTDREGAPSAISSIAKGADGRLWVGTPAGLYRFDGLTFERYEMLGQSLPIAKITTLAADANGGLWVGFARHGIVYLRSGKVEAYERPGGSGGNVGEVTIAPDGTPWAVVGDVPMVFRKGAWEPVATRFGLHGPTRYIRFSPDASMVVNDEKRLLHFPAGSMTADVQMPLKGWPEGLARAKSGKVFYADSSGAVGVFDSTQSFDTAGHFGKDPNGLIADDRGSLWTSDDKLGICRLQLLAGSVSKVQVKGCVSEEGAVAPADVSLTDRDGNIWIAGAKGLYRFSPARFHRLDVPVNDGAALAVDSRGDLWIGTSGSPLTRMHGGSVETFGPAQTVHNLFAAPDGTVWFGAPGQDRAADRESMYKWRLGRIENVPMPAGFDNFPLQSMAMDRKGDIIGAFVRKSLYRLHDGAWTALATEFGAATPYILSRDGEGMVWVGYPSGRVARWDGQTVQWLEMPSSIGGVLSFVFTKDTAWVGGEGGLATVRGKTVTPMTVTQPLRGISGLALSPDGDLWINTLGGVGHAEAMDLAAALQGKSLRMEWLGQADGIHGPPSQLRPLQSAVFSQGQLWFATLRMVGSVAPGPTPRRQAPDTLRLALSADSSAASEGTIFRLPAKTRVVHVSASAVDLSRPEDVLYRFTLNGQPVDSRETASASQSSLTFVGLPHGRYNVSAWACNGSGICSAAPATLSFLIAPHLWEAVWFRVALGLLFCFGLAALALWRYRSLCHRYNAELRGQVAERERIARELHDTLLQGMQGVVLKFQSAALRLNYGTPEQNSLLDTLTQADLLLSQGRDRVRDLRTEICHSGDLGQQLRQIAAAESGHISIAIEGEVRELLPTAHREVLEIAREALRNSVKHSSSLKVGLLATFRRTEFELEVSDDGPGIPRPFLENARPGHYGLSGMRERAESVGGRLEIQTSSGGTVVRLSLPARFAYASRLRWRPWDGLLRRLRPS